MDGLELDIPTPLAALLEEEPTFLSDGDPAALRAPPVDAHGQGQGQAPAPDAAGGAALTPQRIAVYFGENLVQAFSDLNISQPPEEEESEHTVHRILLWDTPERGPSAPLTLTHPPFLITADVSSSENSPPLPDAKTTVLMTQDDVPAWDPAGPPPFLFSGDEERRRFTQRVEDAHDLVRTTWRAEDGAVLAKMLSDVRVLDTPLVSTYAGRLTFQACLHAVRAAAKAEAPVDAIVADLLAPLARAPEVYPSPREAAVASAACCNLAAALGCEAVRPQASSLP
eukprot:tig00021339_g20429.t1